MPFLKRFSNMAKARSGFTLAVVALAGVVIFEVGRRTQFLADYGLRAALGVAAAGFLIIKLDRRQRPSTEDAGTARPAGEETTEEVAEVRLLEARHWGRTLLAIAVIIAGTTLAQHKPVKAKAPPPVAAPEPVAVVIPPITLQGVTVSQGKPIALIDNGTYQIGDVLHGLRIVAITARSVTVTYGGTTNVLQLGENRFQITTTENRLP
jgi:hypothetical protein